MVAYIAEIVTVTVTVIAWIAWIATAMVFPIARTAARMTLAAINSKRQLERCWRFFAEPIFINRPHRMLQSLRLGREVAAIGH